MQEATRTNLKLSNSFKESINPHITRLSNSLRATEELAKSPVEMSWSSVIYFFTEVAPAMADCVTLLAGKKSTTKKKDDKENSDEEEKVLNRLSFIAYSVIGYSAILIAHYGIQTFRVNKTGQYAREIQNEAATFRYQLLVNEKNFTKTCNDSKNLSELDSCARMAQNLSHWQSSQLSFYKIYPRVALLAGGVLAAVGCSKRRLHHNPLLCAGLSVIGASALWSLFISTVSFAFTNSNRDRVIGALARVNRVIGDVNKPDSFYGFEITDATGKHNAKVFVHPLPSAPTKDSLYLNVTPSAPPKELFDFEDTTSPQSKIIKTSGSEEHYYVQLVPQKPTVTFTKEEYLFRSHVAELYRLICNLKENEVPYETLRSQIAEKIDQIETDVIGGAAQSEENKDLQDLFGEIQENVTKPIKAHVNPSKGLLKNTYSFVAIGSVIAGSVYAIKTFAPQKYFFKAQRGLNPTRFAVYLGLTSFATIAILSVPFVNRMIKGVLLPSASKADCDWPKAADIILKKLQSEKSMT